MILHHFRLAGLLILSVLQKDPSAALPLNHVCRWQMRKIMQEKDALTYYSVACGCQMHATLYAFERGC